MVPAAAGGCNAVGDIFLAHFWPLSNQLSID